MNIGRKFKNKKGKDSRNDPGWEDWGGYFDLKKAKLEEQYKETAATEVEKISNIFSGISIIVNGLTNPNAEELKKLMATHGGTYQVYQNSSTTHIIASNLPNFKINKLGPVPIVKPSWIIDSIALEKLLDYRRYLLYTNQSTNQPKLDFPIIPKADSPPKSKTASDPNFLSEFYNNSRLHLIATLGAEFKQYISELREKPRDFPGREKLLEIAPTSPYVDYGTVVMHIDMDCFFVSVGLRNRPELRGLPVAVTHARNPQINKNKERDDAITHNMDRLPLGAEARLIDGKASMSEIASCSYEARRCGVKNGMFLGAAAKLCPEIQTIPYDFEGYKEVSTTLYNTLASYTLDIEPVSCDEMYVDITDLLRLCNLSVTDWSNHIRTEIQTATGCPCSTGFGSNRLQARLATKKAKPCGFYHLKPEDVEIYMSEIPLSELPGVGRATLHKLKSLGLETCGDVQIASLQVLQKEVGVKVGETIVEQAKGIDRKPLCFHHERKSISAEINYGIRFKNLGECEKFLGSLGEEVWTRLNEVKMRARCVTLKLMVRAQDAPVETAKYLGHGICDCLSKSFTSPHPITDVKIIHREIKNLYEKLNVDFGELRGLGIQLSKLEKIAPVNPTLSKFLQQPSIIIETAKPENDRIVGRGRPRKNSKGKKSISNFFKSKKENCAQDKMQIKKEDVCLEVLKELPDEIREEVIKEYNLSTTIEKPLQPELEVQKPVIPIVAKSPFGGLEWEELKPILYEWMKSSPKPDDYDVTLLAEHFRQQSIDSKIDDLRTAMNFLYRNFSQLDCSWHKAYKKIYDFLQEGMLVSFGGKLLVEENFKCCI